MALRWIIPVVFTTLITMGCGTKPSKQPQDQTEVRADHSTLLKTDDFEKKLSETADKTIVDVRTPEEFTSGHIKGAVNINYQGEHFTEEIARLDKTKPVFVYCEMGGRSADAVAFMHKQGFKEIYELKNGLKSWKHFGKPVE